GQAIAAVGAAGPPVAVSKTSGGAEETPPPTEEWSQDLACGNRSAVGQSEMRALEHPERAGIATLPLHWAAEEAWMSIKPVLVTAARVRFGMNLEQLRLGGRPRRQLLGLRLWPLSSLNQQGEMDKETFKQK